MSNFFQRLITGILLIIVFVSCIVISPYSFLILIALINILGLNEFYNLHSKFSPQKQFGLFFSIIIFTTTSLCLLNSCNWKILLLNIPVAFSIFIFELYLKNKNPFEQLAFTFLGIIYITIPLLFLAAIAFLPNQSGYHQSQLVLGFFFIVWTSDSGAYAFGNIFGKHLLFERISPKKTWEGSIGGAFSALLVAFVVSQFYKEIKTKDWMCIAAIIIVVGTYGDLVKSLMKRTLQIKDSGSILPGHGGILDRFDSSLSAAPFVFSYLVLFHN